MSTTSLGTGVDAAADAAGQPGCAAVAVLCVNRSGIESSLAGAAAGRLLLAGRMADMRLCLRWRITPGAAIVRAAQCRVCDDGNAFGSVGIFLRSFCQELNLCSPGLPLLPAI